jgi:hypothetical protein
MDCSMNNVQRERRNDVVPRAGTASQRSREQPGRRKATDLAARKARDVTLP